MVAESAARFEALEDQAERIMGVFARAGYERVAPAFIQPADIFLDRIGEALRNRTYVFTDPSGQELCLRPDLTIPACRIYNERNPRGGAEARYAYNGPAFRYQSGKHDPLRPREFRQAGIECFGVADREQADVEVLGLILDAVQSNGLRGFELHIGDLELFHAFLAALPIPTRWRDRLTHHFWRPDMFHKVLHRMAEEPAALPGNGVGELARKLDPDDAEGAQAQIAAYLDSHGIEYIGARGLDEIAARLLAAAADLREQPLPSDVVKLVQAYLAVSGRPEAALAAIEDLASAAGISLAEQIEACRRRQALMKARGIRVDEAVFDADFGRQLEYYTGFVFQIELPGRGIAGQIAGGGRYDGLLASIGGPADVPTVGSAIHTERLLAVKGGW